MAIKDRQYYDKKTDSIKVRFYNGRKLATEAERKEFIRENYKDINGEYLNKEDRLFYGRVKGGHERSNKAVRIDGKFINDEFLEQAAVKRDGKQAIDFEGLAKALNYDSVNELFKHEPEIYASAKKLFYGDGLEYVYNSENVMENLDKYGGRIFINGHEYSKLKAMERIDFIDKAIKRKFENYLNEFNVEFRKGGGELHFKLPSEAKIAKGDLDDFDEDSESVTIIYPDYNEAAVLKKAERKYKKDNIKPDRFTYKFKVQQRKGRAINRTVTARDMYEAKRKIHDLFPRDFLISVKRTQKKK